MASAVDSRVYTVQCPFLQVNGIASSSWQNNVTKNARNSIKTWDTYKQKPETKCVSDKSIFTMPVVFYRRFYCLHYHEVPYVPALHLQRNWGHSEGPSKEIATRLAIITDTYWGDFILKIRVARNRKHNWLRQLSKMTSLTGRRSSGVPRQHQWPALWGGL